MGIDAAGLDLDRLFRVEIETADGQRAERRQTMDHAEAARAAATPGTVTARAMADRTVQFQWHAERFPFAHVADAESGQALRSGYTDVLVLRTDSRRLAVTLSEGVHTVRRIVRVQSRR